MTEAHCHTRNGSVFPVELCSAIAELPIAKIKNGATDGQRPPFLWLRHCRDRDQEHEQGAQGANRVEPEKSILGKCRWIIWVEFNCLMHGGYYDGMLAGRKKTQAFPPAPRLPTNCANLQIKRRPSGVRGCGISGTAVSAALNLDLVARRVFIAQDSDVQAG